MHFKVVYSPRNMPRGGLHSTHRSMLVPAANKLSVPWGGGVKQWSYLCELAPFMTQTAMKSTGCNDIWQLFRAVHVGFTTSAWFNLF